ncbi:MAG TPA: T9SS type A sorting domain-containing protein [Bacteroidia bacterium]|nr:T9SS type A sorting domain-containing protein [Bacteroidia bacterium]
MFAFLLAMAGLKAQVTCTDLNNYVDSKNTGPTGYYTLQNGQEEMAAQTYHYSVAGKVNSVRVYGNYPGVVGGVPLRVSIANVDANGRPTTTIQSVNVTWWWFDNFSSYMTVNFPGGGVTVNNNYAITVELRNASPWGSSFQLQYTGDGEGLGQDLASLAGTSTGHNWTSAMTNFSKDGDFYLVPRMTHYITPAFSVSSNCASVGTPVTFSNQSIMTTDSMFNIIGLSNYSGSNYFYTWNFGDASPVSHAANPTHTYATAGSYTVTLTCMIDGWFTDGSATKTDVISVGLGSNATATSVSCNGGSNGTITINATGGSSPYSYSINATGFQPGNMFSGLGAGTYTTYVQDNVGCISTGSVTITQPSAIVISNVSSTNSSCGNADGALLISASGGTGTLQYQLNSNPYQSSNSFTGLGSDFYTVTVKDANGCTTSTNAAVNDQGAPSLTLVSMTNISCNSGSNGTIVLNGTGGSGTLQYSTNGGNTWQTNGSFLNLPAGDYLAMVKDASGCSSAMEITLHEPPAISFQVSSTPVGCHGDNDGTVTATAATGGTGTYSYSLNNVNYQSGSMFTGVTAGTYTVYVRDIAGCVATSSVTVTEPTALTASTSVINAGCNGSYDGGITATATGGTAPYIYSLNGEEWQSSGTFDELESGTYMITIRDANGCQVLVNATITQPTLVTASITTGASTCGNANGTLLAVGSGGTGSGYTYSIDGTNFNSSGSFSSLTSGTYNVIVRDGNGCQNVLTTFINDANGPSITSVSSTNVACHDGTDGTITVNSVSGGTGTLQYSVGTTWQLSNSFTGLDAGNYNVLVQDANGCVGQTSVTLTQPNAIVVTTSSTDVTCHGSNNGSVIVNAAGGAGTLAYAIDNEAPFQSSNVFNNLYAGTYYTIVRDAAGCLGSAYFTVNEPAAITMNVSQLNVACYGGNDAAIYIMAMGGTGTLTYSLNGINYQSASSFLNLTAGNYTVYVKDANGCVETQMVIITQPSPLVMNYTVSDVVCSGGNDGVIDLSISGGVHPYYFDWSNNQTTEDIFNLSAGTYSVTLTDGNGCVYSQAFTVSQPANALIVNGVITDATSQSTNDGGVSLTVTGGTGPYTYLWSNGATTQDISNVAPGVYSVIVTDANGCTSSGIFLVSVVSGVVNHSIDGGVKLYPNPANDNFTIDAGNSVIDRVEIYDMLGQVVFANEPKTPKTQISTDGLSQGSYFVQMYIGGQKVTMRLQVSK